jgi:apolipoprotein N-acyltransferase
LAVIVAKPPLGIYKRYAISALAGLMLALAYPKWNLAGLAWLVPGLLLALALGQSGSHTFRIGYIAGLTFHLASLHWLLFIPVRIAPAVGWLALSAYLAVYQGVWVWFCCRLYQSRFAPLGSGSVWEQFLTNRWARQLGWALSCAALWVSCEMIQARLFGGFPWNLLGVSQYRVMPLVQLAATTGVYGLSFLMVWFSVSLISAVALLVFRPARPRDWMAELMLPLFVMMLVVAHGMREVFYAPEDQPTLKVCLVQPSIPQTVIWDPEQSSQRFHDLLELSRVALTNHPDLLVWPEGAVPNLFRYDTNIHNAVTNLVRTHNAWLMLGADDVVWNNEERADRDYQYFNCSFLINPAGRLERAYRKRKLVIFGEYVPFARWLPFLREFTSVHGDFSPGQYPVQFVLSNLNVRTSTLICFEDIFPHLTREYAREDTDFLLNLTNDGWFKESAAQWQHAANAIFRAVENRIPLVRCTNNGLTCWVDELGFLHAVYFPGTLDIYGPGIKTVRIPIRAGKARVRTVYGRHGDWFGWTCVAWSAFLLLLLARFPVGPTRVPGPGTTLTTPLERRL